jgi:hypothetical protein
MPDREVLAIELQGLIDLGFEVETTGFALGEIEVILDETAESAPTETIDGAEDEIPVVGGAAVSRSGDIWRARRHRILCETPATRPHTMPFLAMSVST